MYEEILQIASQMTNPMWVFCGPGVDSRALREKRLELTNQAQIIQDEADLQNRNLTPDEARQLKAIFDEYDDIEIRLRIAEQRESGSRSQGRLAESIDPNSSARFDDDSRLSRSAGTFSR